MQLFFEGLKELYESGNLSRTSYDEAYGYNLNTELEKRVEENQTLDDLELDPVAPSNKPGANQPGGEQPGRPAQPPEE